MENNWRAALHNLGCKVNAYETEKMQRMLEESGFAVVPFTEAADVYVINTCSVTAVADKKSRQMIHRARRRNPGAVVIAAGCYVQREDVTPESLDCDLIIGNDEKHRLAELVAGMLDHKRKILEKELSQNSGLPEEQEAFWDQEARRQIHRHDINSQDEAYEELYDSAADGGQGQQSERTRAFVKIQDGCNQFCTYCIIPYVRGRTRSRSADNVIAEIQMLVGQGYKEVVLTGIHLSSYADGDAGLIDLCERIDRQTGLKRLRISSLEPRIVTEDFVRRLSALPSICPHFHLSLQSGSDTVIARMNRKYTTEEFAAGVGLLRQYFDNPAITTDVIAGFPGESEEEFVRGKAFLEEMRFYEMHVFPYSRRDGTPAAKMKGQLPNRVRQERAGELIALAGQMSEAYRASWKGRQAEVLFEEYEERGGQRIWSGFSREYVRVFVQSEDDLRNQIVNVVYDENAGKGAIQ